MNEVSSSRKSKKSRKSRKSIKSSVRKIYGGRVSSLREKLIDKNINENYVDGFLNENCSRPEDGIASARERYFDYIAPKLIDMNIFSPEETNRLIELKNRCEYILL